MTGHGPVEFPANRLPAPRRAFASLPALLVSLLILCGLIVTLVVLIDYGLIGD